MLYMLYVIYVIHDTLLISGFQLFYGAIGRLVRWRTPMIANVQAIHLEMLGDLGIPTIKTITDKAMISEG